VSKDRQQLLVDSLRRLVRRGARPHLRRILEKTRPEDLAIAMADLPPREAKFVVGTLIEQPDQAALAFAAYDHKALGDLLGGFEPAQLKTTFQRLSSDDAADIMAALPEALRDGILAQLGESDGDAIEELMQFGPDTAGGIMSTEVFALAKEMTAREAIVSLQENPDAEMVFYVYCVNEEGTLVGVLSLRQLLTVPPSKQLTDVMTAEVISVPVTMDQEEVAAIVAKYDLLAVPVVDNFNKLVGVITVDDVIDVLRDEATEDMMRMAGVADEDVAIRSTGRAVKTRLPWLVAAVVGGFASAGLIQGFQARLSQMLVLAAFIPLVNGLSGNVAVQSSTIIVRGVAMGQLDPTRYLAALWRELRVVAALAIVCGLLVAGVSLVVGHGDLALAGAVSSSLILVMLYAAVMGTSVPLLSHRLGIDPAVATGPILTTSIDAIGVLIYFWMAGLWLHI
jgi:magnesium transporter